MKWIISLRAKAEEYETWGGHREESSVLKQCLSNTVNQYNRLTLWLHQGWFQRYYASFDPIIYLRDLWDLMLPIIGLMIIWYIICYVISWMFDHYELFLYIMKAYWVFNCESDINAEKTDNREKIPTPAIDMKRCTMEHD